MKSYVLLILAGMAFLFSDASLRADGAAPAADGSLVDFKKDSSTSQLSFDGGATATLDTDKGAVKCTLPAGKGYPGVKFTDPSNLWNLTGFTGVEAEVTNTAPNNLKIALRVDGGDNWQDSPWDCELINLSPGETKTVHVTFGQSYGNPGYKLSPDHVLRVMVFAVDPDAAGSITISSLKAVK